MSGPSGKTLHSGLVKPVHVELLHSTSSKHPGFESIPPQEQTGYSYCCQCEESDADISNGNLLFDSTKGVACCPAVSPIY